MVHGRTSRAGVPARFGLRALGRLQARLRATVARGMVAGVPVDALTTYAHVVDVDRSIAFCLALTDPHAH
jgi:hypothetical protein